jgi:hypothetical protein
VFWVGHSYVVGNKQNRMIRAPSGPAKCFWRRSFKLLVADDVEIVEESII